MAIRLVTDFLYGQDGRDITQAVERAFAKTNDVLVPEGFWTASTIVLSNGRNLLTAGKNTIIQQTSVPTGTPLINITGSNTTFASNSAVTLRGNIATATNEQDHAVFVRGSSNITNIGIGTIFAENIRGDGVYIGGLDTAAVTNVNIDNIEGTNIYRNVLTVTGVDGLIVKSIWGHSTGYMTFNVEPNPNSQLIKNVRVGSIRGGTSGIVGLSADDFVELVQINDIYSDRLITSNSVPNYPLNSSISRVSLWLRNCNNITIGQFFSRNFPDHAIEYVYNNGEIQGDNLNILKVDWANCNTDENVYNTQMEILNMQRVTLGSGNIVLPAGVGKSVYTESASNTVNVSGVVVS